MKVLINWLLFGMILILINCFKFSSLFDIDKIFVLIGFVIVVVKIGLFLFDKL